MRSHEKRKTSGAHMQYSASSRIFSSSSSIPQFTPAWWPHAELRAHHDLDSIRLRLQDILLPKSSASHDIDILHFVSKQYLADFNVFRESIHTDSICLSNILTQPIDALANNSHRHRRRSRRRRYYRPPHSRSLHPQMLESAPFVLSALLRASQDVERLHACDA
jgi:hypothetical protein